MTKEDCKSAPYYAGKATNNTQKKIQRVSSPLLRLNHSALHPVDLSTALDWVLYSNRVESLTFELFKVFWEVHERDRRSVDKAVAIDADLVLRNGALRHDQNVIIQKVYLLTACDWL